MQRASGNGVKNAIACRTLLLIPLLLAPSTLAAQPAGDPLRQRVIEEYQLGTLHLTVTGLDPETGQPVPPREGTGFVITRDGHALSAAHLFRRAGTTLALRDLSVTARVGSRNADPMIVPRGLLRLDSEFDIALFQIDNPLTVSRLRVIPICFDHDVRPEHEITALGFPMGLAYGPTSGRVRSRDFERPGSFLTQAPFNRGNSGGPVLSSSLSAIGIVTGGYTEAQQINVFLHIRAARDFVARTLSVESMCSPLTVIDALPGVPRPTERQVIEGDVILEAGSPQLRAVNLVGRGTIRAIAGAAAASGPPGSSGRAGSDGLSAGADGAPGQAGGRGQNGADGRPAPPITVFAQTLSGRLVIDASGQPGGNGGRGGDGGQGGAGAQGEAAVSGLFDCRAGPGRGGNGGRGGDAGPGGDAGSGGDAGDVTVVIAALSPDSSIRIVARGGQPGQPGTPGRAAAGGRAGPEGSVSGYCRPAGRNGTAGVGGVDRPAGTPGRPGRDGRITLRIGDEEFHATGELRYPR